MTERTYPICILPYDLESYNNAFPDLPEMPKEPKKLNIYEPVKPSEEKKDGITFFDVVKIIIFNAIVIGAAITFEVYWILLLYVVGFIGLMFVLFEKKEPKSTTEELHQKYIRDMASYKNKVIEIEKKYSEELEIYNTKLIEYKKYEKQVLDEDYIYRYRQNMKKKFFTLAQKPYITNELYKKGVSEKYFFQYLNKYFGEYIKTNLTIKNNEDWFGEKLYLPDFTFYDPKSISIAIEIDEPYVGKDGQPIHYIGFDNNRDEYFRKNKWIVIRFAEEQIMKNPIGCCYFIANKIFELTENKTYVSLFTKEKIQLDLIKQWTKDEAHKLAFNRYRNKYLKSEFIEDIKWEDNSVGVLNLTP